MISPSDLKALQGSTLTVTRTGDKREAYAVRGELVTVSAHRIILADVRSGRTRRIPMDRVVSVTEIEPEFRVLYFSQDGNGAALCSKKEVIENE